MSRHDFEAMSDDELSELSRAAMNELMVRAEVARIEGTAPCPTIWGPGPPWYCIPKCKTGPAGHAGRCEPNMTMDEADAAWLASIAAMRSGVSETRAEASRRLSGGGSR